MESLDAKNFVHLPFWLKLAVLALLCFGVAGSAAIVYVFFNSGGSRDWVLIGISGGQFMLTTFVVAIVLFFSQTDANISTLRDRAEQFLARDGTLVAALARVSLADGTGFTVARGDRRDLFGYDYALVDPAGRVAMRLWCGLNVNRFIVIYRFADPQPATGRNRAFARRLRRLFRFSFGGAEGVGYKAFYEPVPGSDHLVSVWLTVATQDDLLTNPALKLFWSQDIAMMTESVLRTALRHAGEVVPETATRPLPL